MKSKIRGLFVALVFLCVLFPAISVRGADVVLLDQPLGAGLESSREGKSGPGQGGGPTVVRQRTARLNADEIARVESAQSIELQLFDDIRVNALREAVQKGRNGAFVWSGKIAGGENGRLVLSLRDAKVYASIYLGFRTFQIRPLEGGQAGGLSIVRELDTRKIERAGKESATAGVAKLEMQLLPPDERKIIELVNLERSTEGLPLLAYNDKLATTARGHAQDMALHDYSSHDRRDGRKFWQSVFDSGYPISKCGENIAVGPSKPEEIFEALISSHDHRVNIMDPDFREIGVGHSVSPTGTLRHFWAQEFGAAGAKRARNDTLSDSEKYAYKGQETP